MEPSGQGFKSGDLSCHQTHNGLVREMNFMKIDGSTQIGFQLPASADLFQKALIEDLNTIPAELLGPVHGVISCTKDIVG